MRFPPIPLFPRRIPGNPTTIRLAVSHWESAKTFVEAAGTLASGELFHVLGLGRFSRAFPNSRAAKPWCGGPAPQEWTPLSDWLVGVDGADTLDGGARVDTQSGGVGNDLLLVDHPDDRVMKLANRSEVEAAMAQGRDAGV